MAISPLISLQRGPTTLFRELRKSSEERKTREEATAERKRVAGIQERQLKIQESEEARKDLTARDERRLTSIATFSQNQLLPSLEAGNVEDTRQILTSRIAELDADPNQDSTETREALTLLDTNLDQLKQLATQSVQEARFRKLIPEAQEAFTNVRDEQGKIIAQKSSLTGKEIASPRARAAGTEKTPTITELTKLVGPKGETPDLGMTLSELQEKGFKPRGKLNEKQEAQLKSVTATLDKLENLTEQTFTGEPGVINRLWNDAINAWGRLSQNDKELVLFESFSQGTVAQLVRAAGEKGALSNKDIERGLNLIPQSGDGFTILPDTREVALGKIKQLRSWFDDISGKVTTDQPTTEAATAKSISELTDEELLSGF